MIDIKHTPGPWKAVKAHHGPIDIFDPRGRDVVTVYGGGVETKSQEANAYLIAAAPELLEALKGLLSCPEHEGWQAEAAAAIAKAEGGAA